MTSLTYSLSRGLGRLFAPGDEILVSQLDHEANRGPWYALEEHGIVVHEIPLLQNGQLDYRAIPKLISDRTRLVAVGISSNILGTVNDIAQIREMMPSDIHLLLDAVHYAPHYAIDVQELNCDFLLCSAYKFYGPHVGLLYCRPGLLDTIPVDRLRVQEQVGPHRIETGTLNHAALAGVGAAIDFIAHHGDGSNLRSKLSDAMQTIGLHENTLIQRLSRGINSIPGLSLHGPGFESAQRAPTLAMSSVRHTPQYICEKLASEGIHAWDGHFYAIRAAEILGLLDKGGVTRMGIAMYNSAEEIDRTIEVLEHIQQGNA